MKDNLEKAFKESLENYETPYEPSAWDKVSSQLTSSSSVGGAASYTVLKWIVAGVLFGTVLTASYLLWYNDDSSSKEKIVNQNSIQENEAQNTDKKTNASDTEQVSPKQKEPLSANENGLNTKKEESDNIQTPNSEDIQNNSEETKTDYSPKDTFSENDKERNDKSQKIDWNNLSGNFTSKEDEKTYTLGTVSSAFVCSGETVTISNSSEKSIVRCQYLGKVEDLKPGEKIEFIPHTSMVIRFVNKNFELIEAQYVKVYNLPTPDFTYDANIYEEGLPVTTCKSFKNYPKIVWDFDDGLQANETDVKHHFFNKGKFPVSLFVEDENGCKASKTKTVTIRNKYNLMAVDGFKPNDRDARNQTFMPYALTKRDVQFQLTIIDPSDNSIVFTSKDATNTWDGHNMNTGKMTAANKTYIWKVSIQNPLPNERPIYAGTIFHD